MTDPRADPRRFDPRFDPAFQPGYDPGSDPSIAARSAPRRFETAPPSQLTPPDPVAAASDPSGSFAPSAVEFASSVPARSSDASLMEGLLPNADEAGGAAPARGANPFTVTLWVISVVLVAVGVTVFRSLPGIEQQGLFATGDPSTTSFGQVFSLAALSAILVGAGILVATGNLFVLAARWATGRR